MPRGFLVKREILQSDNPAKHLYQSPAMTTVEDIAFGYPPAPIYPGLYHPLALPPRSLGPLGPLGDWGLSLHPMFEPLSLISSPPPLDLSIKATPATPITPPSTPSPASPQRKRPHLEETLSAVTPAQEDLSNNNDESVTNHNTSVKSEVFHSASKRPVSKVPLKKTKAVRKLNFDEDKSSPVSGTIIRDIEDVEADSMVVRKGDIDPAFNVVEVTEEAKAELASIENKIGDYVCRLCRELYEDAFTLAQHRCTCIVHVEYRCPECDKVFNCPANLASHRRWHKPKAPPSEVKRDDDNSNDASECREGEVNFIPCPVCHKRFRRQAYLRKHLSTHAHQLPTAPGGFTIAVPPIQTDLPAAN